MTTIRKTIDQVQHEVEERTDSGHFLTKCGELIAGNFGIFSNEIKADCPGCINPEVKPLTPPSTGRVAKQYRRPKNVTREMGESLRFAHKEVVASMEWLARGGDAQFINNALDRANLAYRFLKDVLIDHKRLPPDPVLEDYEE